LVEGDVVFVLGVGGIGGGQAAADLESLPKGRLRGRQIAGAVGERADFIERVHHGDLPQQIAGVGRGEAALGGERLFVGGLRAGQVALQGFDVAQVRQTEGQI